MTTQEANEKLRAVISRYTEKINQEMRERWNSWQIDLTKKELTEVIFGLISRQVTIIAQYASAPTFWNGDLAPIILRCLVDNYINFAWILKAPEDRTKQFIMHGLGQAKLPPGTYQVTAGKGWCRSEYPPGLQANGGVDNLATIPVLDFN